jgi:hypothetical protein
MNPILITNGVNRIDAPTEREVLMQNQFNSKPIVRKKVAKAIDVSAERSVSNEAENRRAEEEAFLKN